MSRVRDLTEITSLDDADLLYVVDASAGPNGGRKITRANLKTDIVPESASVIYDNSDSTLVATDVNAALDELDVKAEANETAINRLKRGWLQYTNASQQTNSTTTFSTLTVFTDQGSFPNSLLTKTNASDFRADFNGYLKASFFVSGYTDKNDRALAIRFAKNGSGIPYTEGRIFGKDTPNRTGSLSGTFILSCATNDIVTVQFASVESGVVSIIPVGKLTVLIEAYRIS